MSSGSACACSEGHNRIDEGLARSAMPQKADSAAIWLPGAVGGGWGVSEAREGFVTSFASGSVASSCLGAKGGKRIRRVRRPHPCECNLVGRVLALELIDQDDLASEILPAHSNHWSNEYSDNLIHDC